MTPQTPASPADLPLSFDVGELDFETAVLERSLHQPVLLDCWAPWCGPCRSLTPVLDKLVDAYGGRFALAKLNTDEAPQIAAALGLRSIPLVMLFIGGRPVDQFTGALPEGQVRAFLDRHLPPAQEAAAPEANPIEQLRAQATEIAAEQPERAAALLQQALDLEPGHAEATLDLAELQLALGQTADATALLSAVPEAARGERHAVLTARAQLAAARPEGDAKALAAQIAANPRDFEARLALAALHAHASDFGAAFEQLLETVLRDKAEAREKARLQMVEWLTLCPDSALVDRARRRLSMYLN